MLFKQLNHCSMLWLSFLSYVTFSSIPLFCLPPFLNFLIYSSDFLCQNSEKNSDFSHLYKIPVNDLKTIDNLLISSFWGTYQSLLITAVWTGCFLGLLYKCHLAISLHHFRSLSLFLCCIGSPVSLIPYLCLQKSFKWLPEKRCRR